MHLGAVTYNVLKDWDVETIIKNLEAAGFEAVELRTEHKHGVEPTLGKEERERIKKRFANSKIRLLSYGSTCEFHSPDPAVRKQNIETGKRFVELAHDTGAWGVKVRPNGFPKELPREATIENIGNSLRQLGEYGQKYGVEIWMEVHGRETQLPEPCAAMMKVANHKNVGLCWNSNPTDIVNGSVKQSWDLLKPWVKSAHITELANPSYPYRELFSLMRQSGYDRYTLMEAQESKEPERFLQWYRALWTELNRPCGA
ncbi:MAG TPA: sugar phosphate isomerase/epimerase family protein [Bryobacteraceae bacterium]|nr:sugar phosphate isomerase/epimerase family protein [Bryobacteraceae bacterium]